MTFWGEALRTPHKTCVAPFCPTIEIVGYFHKTPMNPDVSRCIGMYRDESGFCEVFFLPLPSPSFPLLPLFSLYPHPFTSPPQSAFQRVAHFEADGVSDAVDEEVHQRLAALEFVGLRLAAKVG